MKQFKPYIVPCFFLLLSLATVLIAGVSLTFVTSDVYDRFVRNSLFALALYVPIVSGMGINFSITIGAMAGQAAMIFILDYKIEGFTGLLVAVCLALCLSFFLGQLIGYLLNKAAGREMIVSLLLGLLGNSFYHLIYMVAYGTIVQPHDPSLLLSGGVGLRNTLDASSYKKLFNNILSVRLFSNDFSLLPILLILLVGFLLKYIINTKTGLHMKAVGENTKTADLLGVDTDKIRRRSIVISTMVASLGQIFLIQNIGVVSVYSGHLNSDLYAAAAILVGGATFTHVSLSNIYIGTILFHILFVTSPLAGQKLFGNPALGEYLRSFITYGTIVLALYLNLKNERKVKSLQS